MLGAPDLTQAVAGYVGRIQKRDSHGNWSVIATAGGDLGQVESRTGLAVDSAGNLYIAESNVWSNGPPRIQKRDVQGMWSMVAAAGDAPGQVDSPTWAGLAVDGTGNLYVSDQPPSSGGNDDGRIQKRDGQGGWSVIAAQGAALGQVSCPEGLALDTAGNLYVADTSNHRVQKYTPGP